MTSVPPEFQATEPPALPIIPFEVELLAEVALLRAQDGLGIGGPDAERVRAAESAAREQAEQKGAAPDIVENIVFYSAAAQLVLDEIIAHCDQDPELRAALTEQEQKERGFHSRLYVSVLQIGLQMQSWGRAEKSYKTTLSDAQAVCATVTELALNNHWSGIDYLSYIATMKFEAAEHAPETELPTVPLDAEMYINEMTGHHQIALKGGMPETDKVLEDLETARENMRAQEIEPGLGEEYDALLAGVASLITEDLHLHMDIIEALADSEMEASAELRAQSQMFANLLETGQKLVAWILDDSEKPELDRSPLESDEQKVCCGVVCRLLREHPSDHVIDMLVDDLSDHAEGDDHAEYTD